MPVRWRTSNDETFTLVTHSGILGKVFGGAMLVPGALFLFWVGRALVRYIQFATVKEWLAALPGLVTGLLLTAMFVIPGALLGFATKKTHFSKKEGTIRVTTKVFFVPIRKTQEIPISQATSVFVTHKKKVVAVGKGITRATGSDEPFLTIQIRRGDKPPLDVAHEHSWDLSVVLARQLAEFLGVSGPPLSRELANFLGDGEKPRRTPKNRSPYTHR